jgi:hypothetical protein
MQSSVTKSWEAKIRKTITTLKSNGFQVRQLIYCSNLDILRDADAITKELRKQKISLDIRDRNYFATFANHSIGCVTAAEDLARRFVDPLLARFTIDASDSALSDEEERVAAAYLQIALADKDPSKALTKFSYETLVKYALRSASADYPLPKTDLVAAIRKIVSSGDSQRTVTLISAALDRLVKRNVVKHHTKQDAFTLENKQRKEIANKLVAYSGARLLEKSIVEDRVDLIATQLGIDFIYDRGDIAHDALLVCDHVLFAHAQAAAKAFARNIPYAPTTIKIVQHVDRLYNQKHVGFRAANALQRAEALDLLVPVAEDLLLRPSEAIRSRFRATLDAYCLLFVLKETPDAQQAVNKVLGNGSILVDTNLIIPCMAESLLPKAERRMTRLLSAAAGVKIRLVVVDDVLEELERHLAGVRYTYALHQATSASIQKSGASFGFITSPLVTTYELVSASNPVGSFSNFLDRFAGQNFPRQDLIEYLKNELHIEYDSLEQVYRDLTAESIADLYSAFSKTKHRPAWMDEGAFERLVMHDTRSLLVVEKLRARELGATPYGSSWWWLTLDRVAHRVDSARRGGRPLCCMSPDFFAQFLSLKSKLPDDAAFLSTLPVSVEVAAMDLIPNQLREQALEALMATENEPEFIRKRRLRDLVYEARTVRGDILEGGMDDIVATIEEAIEHPIAQGLGDSSLDAGASANATIQK